MSTALISLPVAKYSFSTEPKTVTKFSWKHVYHVLVVFDSFRNNMTPSSSQSRRCMKIVHGTNTLEFVDIEGKARESKEIIANAKLLKIDLRYDQLSSMALHRRTEKIIAMRYSLPDNYIRRIQLRFNSIQDFDGALSALDQVGFPHAESASPNARDASQVTSNAIPVVAPSPSIQPVPSSSHTNSDHIHSTPSEYFTASEARSLMVGSLGERSSDGPSSETLLPSDPLQLERLHSSHRIYRSITSAPSWSPAQHYRPFTALPTITEHDRETGASRPGPSDLDYRHMEHPRSNTALRPTAIAPQPFEIRSDPVFPSHHAVPGNSTRLAPVDGFQNQIPRSDPWRPQDHSAFSSAPVAPAHPNRPSTAPISHFQTGLEDMVPPRRELPFKRRYTPSCNENSSRPSTSTNLPPLRKPSFVGDEVLSPVAAARPPTAQSVSGPKRQSTSKGKEGVYDLRPTTVSKGKASVDITGTPTRHDSSSSTYEALRDRSANAQPASQERIRPATSSIQPTIQAQGGLGNNPVVQSSSPFPGANSMSNESLAVPLKDALERLGTYIQAESNNKENLAAYASLPNEERRAVLENSVLELINDDGFAQLCEDLYGVWQRIGLGP